MPMQRRKVCSDQDHVQLSDLRRRGLVLYDSSTKRYRLHDLARLFAHSRLSAEERAVGQKRHATHYKDVLSAAQVLYLQGGEALAGGLAVLDLEWRNIQDGHAWVARQDVEANADVAQLGMDYPNAGYYILDLRQHPRERIHWLEISLTAARRLKDVTNEGYALNNLGLVYASLGETKRAIQFYEQRLPIAREIGDRRSEGGVLNNLGNAYYNLGETKRAIQFYEQALLIFREIGDRRLEGASLGNLGSAYADLGETKRAIQFYEQRLTIAREIGDRRGEGIVLNNLGKTYADLGETKRALEFYEQRLTIAREMGDRRGEAITLSNMSLVLDRLGKRTQAVKYAKQSLGLYEQIEDPYAAQVRQRLAAWREESGHD